MADIKYLAFTSQDIVKLVGITYHQLTYWLAINIINASVSRSGKPFKPRLFSKGDLIEIQVIKRLLDANISLQRIRKVINYLKDYLKLERPLRDTYLAVWGNDVVAILTSEEIISALNKQGQIILFLALGTIEKEVDTKIINLQKARERRQKKRREIRGERELVSKAIAS